MYDPNSGFTIINFPYQIFGISEMKFYDFLTNNSALMVYFDEYEYDFVGDEESTILLTLYDNVISDLEVYNSNKELLSFSQSNEIFFTDIIDVYFRISSETTPFPLYDMATPLLAITDEITGTILGLSLLEWDNSIDKYHSSFALVEELSTYDLVFTLVPSDVETRVNSTDTVTIDLIPQFLSEIALKNEREITFNDDYTFTLSTKFNVGFLVNG